ncbi:MAG TPA: hypothetical protein VFB02_04060 [Bradyrhizobium sp.]|nr:hypothetical protein [Bradyrhizobium sp.]
MRASTAFFVGVGTVCLAITGGLAGGLVIGNIMSPPPAKHAAETTRSKQPAQPMPAASPLPYAASTLAFTDPSMKPKAPPADQKEPKVDSGTAASPPPVPAVTKAAASTGETSKPADHPTARQPAQEAQQAEPAKQEAAPAKQANAPEDANAKDANVKARNSDLKHAGDRRRASRAQRWAARHSYGQGRDQNQDQSEAQSQDQNGSANSERPARDDRNSDRGNSSATYSYNYSDRRYRDDNRGRYRDAERDDDDRGPGYAVDEGPRFGFPRIQLFGPDD